MKSLCLLLLLTTLGASAQAAELIYSYYTGKAGAVARAVVDPATGTLSAPEVLYEEETSNRLETLRSTPDHRYLIVENHDNDNPHLLIGDRTGETPEFTRVALSDRPRHSNALGNHAAVIGHQGRIHLLSLPEKKVLAETVISKELDPPAPRPEAVAIAPDGSALLVVFMQDSPTGRARGGRLAVLDVPSLKLRHDLILPREQPDLDFPQGSRDRGPLPMDLIVDAETNTVAIFCRLYGAVAVADLDAALAGEWKNFQYLFTGSAPGAGGPDQSLRFTQDEIPYLFVSNASAEGGAAFLNLRDRKVAARVESGPRGLATPVYLPQSRKLAAVRTGMQWSRGAEGLERDHKDQKDFLRFDLAGLSQGTGIQLEQVAFPNFLYRVGAVPGSERFVVAAEAGGDEGLRLISIAVESLESPGAIPAGGVVRNFVFLP